MNTNVVLLVIISVNQCSLSRLPFIFLLSIFLSAICAPRFFPPPPLLPTPWRTPTLSTMEYTGFGRIVEPMLQRPGDCLARWLFLTSCATRNFSVPFERCPHPFPLYLRESSRVVRGTMLLAAAAKERVFPMGMPGPKKRPPAVCRAGGRNVVRETCGPVVLTWSWPIPRCRAAGSRTRCCVVRRP